MSFAPINQNRMPKLEAVARWPSLVGSRLMLMIPFRFVEWEIVIRKKDP